MPSGKTKESEYARNAATPGYRRGTVEDLISAISDIPFAAFEIVFPPIDSASKALPLVVLELLCHMPINNKNSPITIIYISADSSIIS